MGIGKGNSLINMAWESGRTARRPDQPADSRPYDQRYGAAYGRGPKCEMIFAARPVVSRRPWDDYHASTCRDSPYT